MFLDIATANFGSLLRHHQPYKKHQAPPLLAFDTVIALREVCIAQYVLFLRLACYRAAHSQRQLIRIARPRTRQVSLILYNLKPDGVEALLRVVIERPQLRVVPKSFQTQ
jgi:hypothetical protein